MDLKIPKVLAKIDLGGYDPALSGQFLTVWLNPPLAVLREHDALINPKKAEDPKKQTDEDIAAENRQNEAAMNAWYARLWSQGEDAAMHWTAAEIAELNEQDPALLSWLIRSTWESRGAHISKKKQS